MSVVITSLFANPLHVGHLEYLRQARALGHFHIAIVNTDAQVAIKGSKTFMDQSDRLQIVASLKSVDEAVLAVDEDGSVCATLAALREKMPFEDLIFAKGGDRNIGNIPEVETCHRLNIRIVDGLGAKIRASSTLLANV